MALYSTFAEAIHSYTGVSPAAFFTILALMVGVYRLVSGMFVAPDAELKRSAELVMPAVPTEPVQIGNVTEEELRAYDGSDLKKPLLMAIKGQIYDVSRSRMFYGPGGPYALFAGRDASRALALMSFDSADLTGNLDGLGSADLEVLQDWEYKFMEKYPKVGQLTKKTILEDNSDKIEVSQESQNTVNVDKDNTVNVNKDLEGKDIETEVGTL